MKLILKQETTKLLLYSVTIVTMSITSCKKQFQSDSGGLVENKTVTGLIKTAQTYFTENVVKAKTENHALSNTSDSKRTEVIQSSQIEKLNKLVKWESAAEYSINGMSYAIVPISDPRKPFKNKEFEFFRSAIFYTSDLGDMQMTVVEILSKKGYSLGDNLQGIANASFLNKGFSKNNSISDINAYVIFYDKNYLQEASFQLIDGKWAKARVSFRSDLEIAL